MTTDEVRLHTGLVALADGAPPRDLTETLLARNDFQVRRRPRRQVTGRHARSCPRRSCWRRQL